MAINKQRAPGGEVDAYCTKCRMDLHHRIVAMEGDKIARVECLTCHTQHNYYRPKSDEPDKPARAPRAPKESSPSSARPRSATALRKQWEQAVLGKSPQDFTPYTIAARFAPGQLVRHSKFGEGVVAEIVDPGKVQILFEDGAKLLVQGKA